MKRAKMSLFSCILMGIGSIIGASIFATTPIAIKIVGGNGIVVGFLLAAVFVFLRTWPEMVAISALPANGASYMHLTRLMHPSLGILNAVGYLVLGPVKIATMALTFSTYFAMLVPATADPVWNTVVAIVITLIFTVLTLYSIQIAAWVQNVLVAVLLVAIGVYIFGGLGATVVPLSKVISSTWELGKMWAAMGIMHGSLIGANALMYVADEIESPGRNIPIAFIVGTVITAIIFAAMAYVTVGVMPQWFKIDNLATVAKVFMSKGMLAFFVSGGALLAVVTSINAAILMFSRSHFAAARDHLYPALIMKINRHGVPGNAVLLNSAIAILFMAAGFNLTDVINITTIPGLLFSPIIFAVVFFIPRKYPASYKTSWLYIPHWINCIIAVVAAVAAFILGMYVLKQMQPKNWITMIAFYAAAAIYVVVRAIWLKRKKGIDMIGTMRKGYAPWDEREKAAVAELAAKKA